MALTEVVSEGLPKVTREEVTGLEAVSGRRLPSSRGTKGKGSEAGGGAWRIPGMTDFRYCGLGNILLLKWKPLYYFLSQHKPSINMEKKNRNMGK